MKLSLRAGDETRTVRVVRRGDRMFVTFEDGGDVELQLLSTLNGGFELENGHARIHGAGTVINGRRQLWVNGRNLTYERAKSVSVDRPAPAETNLSATIPSVVLEVLVQPGQRVVAGQKLVLLESMKMVMPILAPQDAIVSRVCCRPGESVDAGVAVVELETASAA